MKVTKNPMVLSLIATMALAITVSAVDRPLYPKADSGPRVIASTGVTDPNLLAAYPQPGSRGLAAPAVAATGIKDPDTLAAVKNCTMSAKTKDTAECKKMCETAAAK